MVSTHPGMSVVCLGGVFFEIEQAEIMLHAVRLDLRLEFPSAFEHWIVNISL